MRGGLIPGTMTRTIAVLAALLALTLALLVVSRSTAAPVLSTDKEDYYANEIVPVSGNGFAANTLYDIPVIRPDGSIVLGDGSFLPGWDSVTSDGLGDFTYLYQLNGIFGTYEVRAYNSPWSGDLAEAPVAVHTFTDANIDFNQCKNDSNNDDIIDPAGCTWINGGLNQNNSLYTEGSNVPQRLFHQLPEAGTHILGFNYEFSNADTYAYDFLTSPDETQSGALLNECGNLPGFVSAAQCTAVFSTNVQFGDIPSDPFDTVAARENPAGAGARKIRLGCTPACSAGVTVEFPDPPTGPTDAEDNPGGDAHDPDSDPDCFKNCGKSDAVVTVTVTTTSADTLVGLWFAGHLAESADPLGSAVGWGTGCNGGGSCGSSAISGAPFHVRYICLQEPSDTSCGNVGNRDNQIQSGGVAAPGSVTIVKDTIPDDPQDFSFAGDLGSFSLEDDGDEGDELASSMSFTGLVAGSYAVTETVAAGWTLTGLACAGDTDSGSIIASPTVTIDVDSGEDITCTFTNTLNSATFTVKKDFSDKPATDTTPVTVTLTCVSGVVTPASASASELTPAVFTVTGFTPDPNCTATEAPIPAGYTSSGTCVAALVAVSQCTITNTLRTATITVQKDFSDKPSTDTTTVSVTLVCTSGSIAGPNPKNASELTPAVFTVTGFNAGATCTATESVPVGYTASQLNCSSVSLVNNGNVNCTITNNLNTTNFTVLKDFDDKPATDTTTVTVTLTCDTGVVTPTSASASELTPAVFTVTGFTPDPNCTATESPVPAGYNSTGTCVAALQAVGQCTITNTLNTATFTVLKDFDDKPSTDTTTVTVTLTCDTGVVTPASASASELTPAVFTVTGFTPDPNCTATESPVPAGYNSTGTCVAALVAVGQCTITNTLNTATFTVLKDFSDKPSTDTTPVTVTLTCDTGVVTPASASASELNPAVFTVTGFTPDPNCTATESPVPAGYFSTATCSAALVAVGQCTITNNLTGAIFTVNKDFDDKPGTDTTTVTVTLTCASGTIDAPNPTTASEAVPAVFNVTGFTGDPNCTATESPVPAGYTSSGTCVAALVAVGQCTITNALRTATITVQKDFLPDSLASVTVTLVCTSGTIGAPNPTSATEALPAVFTVTGFNAGATCTATESVPVGYTATQLNCSSVSLVNNGNVNCTITNDLNVDTFTVLKDFDDKPSTDTTTVTVTLTCDTGVVTPASALASELTPAVFTVTGFTPDPNCTASESPVPAGYNSTGTCSAALVAVGQCTITNTLNSATFTVNKDFIPDNAASVSVTLVCDDGTITPPTTKSATEAVPAVWTVTGITGSANCTASESPVPAGHTASGCTASVILLANGTANCTITNSGTSATFTVNKDFIPDNAASVSVTLVCDDGTIAAPNPTSATEAAPAVFIVNGITGSANCTASESPVPAGHTASGCTTSVILTENGANSCTITNTQRTGTVTVNKDFLPDSGASVSVTLVCSSGSIVVPNPKSATEALPAVFTVKGFNAGATCTATEGVPAGYTASQLDCASKLLVDGGDVSCTITNTERNGTVTVNKDFVPDDAASVSVTLVCTSGSIVVPNPKSATEALPAVFTVKGFDAGATCTATEATPAGYVADDSDCVSKLLVDAGNVSCTIVNTESPVIFTVNKDFLPDSAASVSVTLSCTSGTIIAPNPKNATEAAPAVFTVTGFAAGATCTATEAVPSGYVANQLDCVSKLLPTAGGNVSCTITNTERNGTVTVNKDFVPDNAASVSVTLVCSSGSIVVPNPKSATEALPAVFTVKGFDAGATCTATEGVPAGYTANQLDCVSKLLVDGGNVSCTITNTLISTATATFTVHKDFTDKPSTDTTTVTVTLACASGTVAVPNPQSASEAVPAFFTVNNFTGDPNCTATEAPIPAGYSSTGTCVAALVAVGQCTITNALVTTASVNVQVDFVPDNPASVTISVTCTSGSVVDVDTSSSEADDANFTVSSFTDPGTTCTATEAPPPPLVVAASALAGYVVAAAAPAGYVADESDCLNLAIPNGAVVTCTIVYMLGPVGGVVDIFVPGTTGDDAGTGVALFGLIFIAVVALLSAGVATVRVTRRRLQ